MLKLWINNNTDHSRLMFACVEMIQLKFSSKQIFSSYFLAIIHKIFVSVDFFDWSTLLLATIPGQIRLCMLCSAAQSIYELTQYYIHLILLQDIPPK